MSDALPPRKLDFASLCNLILACNRITPSKAGTAPSNKILDYFASFSQAARQCSNSDTGVWVFRLLFPDLDVRRRYGLKETLLLEQLYQILGIARDGQAAQILRRWNDPEIAAFEQPGTGCLGVQVLEILKSRRGSMKAKPLGLEKVNTLLDQLATFSPYSNVGSGLDMTHAPTRTQILRDLYAPLDAWQAAVMTQIILKDLTPLLYPAPSSSPSVCLKLYNSNAYRTLELRDAMRIWHWALPALFRCRNDVDEAVRLVAGIEAKRTRRSVERLKDLCKAHIGSLVEIPKARKGSSIANTIHYYQSLAGSAELWCETKYDGERMQIHLDEQHNIRIYSKSKRDSTNDRLSTHPIIRAALGLPPRQHKNVLLAERSMCAPRSQQKVSSIIVEAEMVAFNETRSCIDEFWRIGQIKDRDDKTGASVIIPESQLSTDVSQTTSSTISPGVTKRKPKEKELHFQLVFFDLLYLNGESLVHETYQERRARLERVVRAIPGFSMLAERRMVELTVPPARAAEALESIFDEICHSREEGLILKASASLYNDMKRGCQWTKLKKDYIEGMGDSGSFVILGASHDKERGRQLGVNSAVWTTFYAGLQTNRASVRANPALRPDYHVLFSVSWGLDRAQLDYINDYSKRSAGSQPFTGSYPSNPWLPYTFKLSQGLESRPAYLFAKPMVFEVYGGGWTRAAGALYYALRFPRISCLHCHSRHPAEALDLPQSEAIAAQALSKNISFGNTDADGLWTHRGSASPAKSPRKRSIQRPSPGQPAKRSRTLATGDERLPTGTPVTSTTSHIPSPSKTLQHQLSIIREESSSASAIRYSDHGFPVVSGSDAQKPSSSNKLDPPWSDTLPLSPNEPARPTSKRSRPKLSDPDAHFNFTHDSPKSILRSGADIHNISKSLSCLDSHLTASLQASLPSARFIPPQPSYSNHFWCFINEQHTPFGIEGSTFSSHDRLHSAEAVALAAGWVSTEHPISPPLPGSTDQLRRGYIFVDSTCSWKTQVGALLNKVRRRNGAKPVVVYDAKALHDIHPVHGLQRCYRLGEVT